MVADGVTRGGPGNNGLHDDDLVRDWTGAKCVPAIGLMIVWIS